MVSQHSNRLIFPYDKSLTHVSMTTANWYEERLAIEQVYQKKPDLTIVSNKQKLQSISSNHVSPLSICLEARKRNRYQLPQLQWYSSSPGHHQAQAQAGDLRSYPRRWLRKYTCLI